MRVLVTGAAGHIGGNLVRGLLEDGRQVRVLLYRDKRAVEGLDVEVLHGDLLDPSSLRSAVDGVESVFHAAASVDVEGADPEATERTNVGGTRDLLAAACDAGVKRFVHFSSVHAYSQRPTHEILTEERALADGDNDHPYDRTKARAQTLVSEASGKGGMETVVLNPTAVVGPYDFKPSRMGDALTQMATGTMPALLKTGFDWVDVRDIVRSAIAAEQQGRGGESYILPGRWASMVELAAITERLLGTRAPRFAFPLWTAYLGLPFAWAQSKVTGKPALYTRGALHMLAVQCDQISHEKSAAELGHQSRPLEETLRDTFEWMKTNQMIPHGEGRDV